LFFYPGLVLFVLGTLVSVVLGFRDIYIAGIGFGVHTLLFSALSVVVGFQLIQFAYLSKVFAVNAGLVPGKSWLTKFRQMFSLEKGLVISALMMVLAVSFALVGVNQWAATSFGELDPARVMRVLIPSATLFSLGVQIFFGSFFAWFLYFERDA
jgi:hypothetical protein